MIMNTIQINPQVVEPLIVSLGDRSFQVERPFGALASKTGKLTDVAVGPTGLIYALTRRDHYVEPEMDCVNVLSADGTLIGAFGGDRIIDAHKLACDASGNIWVVDRDAHEIVAFDPSGREIATLGSRHRPGKPFNHPADLCFAPDGSIWVADGYGHGHIHRFTSGGKHVLTAGSVGCGPGEFLTPHGIGVLSDGSVVVADRENGRVQLFDVNGSLISVWDQFYRPSSIWITDDDLIHVVDAIPTLTCLTADGTVLGRCRPSLNGPHGMSGGSDGSIYLAETNPHRISRLLPLSAASQL